MRFMVRKETMRDVEATARRARRPRVAPAVAALVSAALAAVLAAAPAAAQGPRGRGGMGGFGDGPKWWGSVWGGYQWSNNVGDPSTNSTWGYDSGLSFRLTAEREVAPNIAVGVAWNYSRMPLAVVGNSSASVCRAGCAADGTVASYGLTLRSGGGRGFHIVYEGFLGAMQYSNFSVEGEGAAPFADVKDTDFAWAFGTGFGYALSSDFQLVGVFEYGNSVHEKSSDLFQRRTTQHYTTRVGLRVGL